MSDYMAEFKKIRIRNTAPSSAFAAEHFCIELNKRIDGIAKITESDDADIVFVSDGSLSKDDYSIVKSGTGYVFRAASVRAFYYAVGRFLRKVVNNNDSLALICDISGEYHPDKSIRGHQLGYRTTPNTYDAWSLDEYERYYLDLMYFGVNTIEHIPLEDEHSFGNALMRYKGNDLLIESSEVLDRYDIDLSLWHPNYMDETDESACKKRKKLYSRLKRLDYLFIPGGDPGSLPADVFVKRCREISKVLKAVHPEAKLYPSAQAPHEYDNWGEEFLKAIDLDPDGIDGIIYGPNHAFLIDELSEKLGGRFPLRFYPDITHNVRCEYPVHYDKNDWHYALATCLGRECTNPRPHEYFKLYKETEKFFIGSVSYSEGITDDVNKFLWSALDYDSDISAEEAVSDYARTFFFSADTEKITELIFGLEENWQGNPAVNNSIEKCLSLSESLLRDYPFLSDNWRFNQLYLRAACDKLIKLRFVFENDLIDRAKTELVNGRLSEAADILKTDFTEEYRNLRRLIDILADMLFIQIGYQSDTERYLADNPERGAILDTIDLPVTDRAFLITKASKTATAEELLEYFNINSVDAGEYYFSVALNNVTDVQTGEPYFNFQGDRPKINDGTLRTALFNVFDNFVYSHIITGLNAGCDYTLRVTYLDKRDPEVDSHRITVNGNTVYCGVQFGEIDEEYTRKFCREGFVTAKYTIPAGYINSGENILEFSEPRMGIMFAEYSMKKQ
jgi:hypothetical protein